MRQSVGMDTWPAAHCLVLSFGDRCCTHSFLRSFGAVQPSFAALRLVFVDFLTKYLLDHSTCAMIYLLPATVIEHILIYCLAQTCVGLNAVPFPLNSEPFTQTLPEFLISLSLSLCLFRTRMSFTQPKPAQTKPNQGTTASRRGRGPSCTCPDQLRPLRGVRSSYSPWK